MAEFAASNYINVSIKLMSFFANYEFYPQTGIEFPGTYENSKKKEELLVANEIMKRQENIMGFLQDQLA